MKIIRAESYAQSRNINTWNSSLIFVSSEASAASQGTGIPLVLFELTYRKLTAGNIELFIYNPLYYQIKLWPSVLEANP